MIAADSVKGLFFELEISVSSNSIGLILLFLFGLGFGWWGLLLPGSFGLALFGLALLGLGVDLFLLGFGIWVVADVNELGGLLDGTDFDLILVVELEL